MACEALLQREEKGTRNRIKVQARSKSNLCRASLKENRTAK